MEIYVLFGQPGAGKTYIGGILKKYFGFYLYDGDQDMSQELKGAIVDETVTDDLRQEFFNKLIESVGALPHSKIVVTQTFIKEKFRKKFKDIFPKAKFILVETDVNIREKRVMMQERFQLPLEKWRKMFSLFEEPKVPYEIINNDVDGEEEIKKQLQVLLK